MIQKQKSQNKLKFSQIVKGCAFIFEIFIDFDNFRVTEL